MDGSNPGLLATDLKVTLRSIAATYGLEFGIDGSVAVRFSELVTALARKFGRNVVILVDEYDVPMHGLEKASALYAENQAVLRSVFQQCKANDAFVKFCFVTGVARFNQTSLYSGPNNFTDISMAKEFATVCGFTKEEIVRCIAEGIQAVSYTHLTLPTT